MDLASWYPAVVLLLFGCLAGGLFAWLITRVRANARASTFLVETKALVARLQEKVENKEKAVTERDGRIDRLEKALGRAETDVLKVSQECSAAQAKLEQKLEQISGLQRELAQKKDEAKELSLRLSSHDRKQVELETILDKERSAMEEKLQLIENAKDKLSDTFEALSAKTLKNSQESFLELARVALAKDQTIARKDLEKRQEAITQIVKPIQETLGKYDKQIQEMERMRERAYGGLSQQVQSLAQTQQQLYKETANLVKALRTPHVRGRWGEITLKRVAELAGMLNHCDFVEQETRTTEHGLLRPDMIVKLPNDRRIVVDSKVPLLAFLDALEAQTEEEKDDKMALHAKQVQAHINKLSQKSYWEQFQPTPEFVVLFIPGENFFSAALERNPGLIEEGVNKGVILATPTTLISLLKAVAFGWRQETMAQNAERISALGMTLYERIGVMAEHLENLGKHIERCTSAFNQTIGSFERRVLVTARRFHDLGIEKGDGGKLVHIDPMEKNVRKIGLLDSNIREKADT